MKTKGNGIQKQNAETSGGSVSNTCCGGGGFNQAFDVNCCGGSCIILANSNAHKKNKKTKEEVNHG